MLGTVDDWILLRTKIERLAEFDDEDDPIAAEWLVLLLVICNNLVESTKNGSHNNLWFWDTIVSHHGGGSGPSYVSGWVSTFSFFNKDGNRCGTKPSERRSARWSRQGNGHGSKASQDGEVWPMIDTDDINPNVVSCPVLIDDNGVQFESRLFVGQVTFDLDPATEFCKEVLHRGVVEQGTADE